MTRTLARSAALAASVLVWLTGCGGGGTPSEAPKTPATAPAATAPPPGAQATPPTTVAGAEDDGASPLLAWAEAEPDCGAPLPECKAGVTVQFTADVDGGKQPLKYVWKFGDGKESSEANPKHTYDKAGTFRADLEVSDAAGDSDSDYVDMVIAAP